ncbi:MAG TPA: RDD family protein [Vicinamibacteria bacterium]|nr:RDD family protein [Vicinamibacteria bacterium]
MICAECRTEIDVLAVICPGCGARRKTRGEQADWRDQVREVVDRHRERKRREISRRDDDARQLSIFPETPEEDEQSRVERLRRAEIRARVEERAKKRRPTPAAGRLFEAGELPLPSGSAAARELRAEGEWEPIDTTTAEFEPLTDFEQNFGVDTDSVQEEPISEAAFSNQGPASVGERAIAGFIDIVFVVSIQLTLFYLTTHLVAQRIGALPRSALAAMAVVGAVLAAGYYLFFWALSGQTLGKLLTGGRIVDRRGRALGFARAATRLAGVLLAALPLGAGFIGLWTDPERRGWHDRIAGTKVIRG